MIEKELEEEEEELREEYKENMCRWCRDGEARQMKS